MSLNAQSWYTSRLTVKIPQKSEIDVAQSILISPILLFYCTHRIGCLDILFEETSFVLSYNFSVST